MDSRPDLFHNTKRAFVHISGYCAAAAMNTLIIRLAHDGTDTWMMAIYAISMLILSIIVSTKIHI